MNKIQCLALSILVTLVTGCATSVGGLTHYSVDQQAIDKQAFDEVLVLPVDASVYELGLASMEKVPEWSEQARQVMQTELDAMFGNEVAIQLTAMPELSAEEKLLLDEHVALYRQVVGALRGHQAISGWQHKKAKVDGTVGSGLGFLHEKTGADVALLVSGVDVKSSGGRMVAAGAAAVLFGASMPMGHSEVVVGYLNLHTGDVLWSNQSFSTSHGLLGKQGARSMLGTAFSGHDRFLAKLDAEDR